MAKLEDTVKVITDAGGQAEAMACDVSDTASVDAVVEKVVADWGKLDILINNAGITKDTLLPVMTDEQWDDVIRVNLRGTFLFTRAASKQMMKKRYGRVINISSVSGLIGNPGQSNYSASKAGVIGMTRSFAKEIAKRKVTVNAVAPGFIESEMTEKLGETILGEVKKRIPAKRIGGPRRRRGLRSVSRFSGGELRNWPSSYGRWRDDGLVFRFKSVKTVPNNV